jgi:aerobic carbon-monoxide dehydrogenase small subunit
LASAAPLYQITLKVNGQTWSGEVAASRTLVQVMRDDLRLTGTKEACAIGVCGVCSVVMNGRLVTACLLLAVQADGAEIATIEGVGSDGGLHPVQESFIRGHGFQCGICTPGQIVAAMALLQENPRPSTDEVRDWMAGNLCRCTGYYQIIQSVLDAARRAGHDQ